jgi:hypothetical protein
VRVDAAGKTEWMYCWDEEEGRRNHKYDRKILAVDLPTISDFVAVAGLYRNSPQRVNCVVVRSGSRVRVVKRRMRGELSHFHYLVVAARKTFLVLVPVPVLVLVLLSVVAVLGVVGGANDRTIAGRR